MENDFAKDANSSSQENALERNTNNHTILHTQVLQDIQNTQKEMLTTLHTLIEAVSTAIPRTLVSPEQIHAWGGETTQGVPHMKNPPPRAPASQVQARRTSEEKLRLGLAENQVHPSQLYITLTDAEAILQQERARNTLPHPPYPDLHSQFCPAILVGESSKNNPSTSVAATTSAHPSHKLQGEEGDGTRLQKRKEREDAKALNYPCSIENVEAIVTTWAIDGEIELPDVDLLPSQRECDSPNFCVYHR